MTTYSSRRAALDMIRKAERINIGILHDNPGAKVQGRQVLKRHNKAGKSHKELQLAAKPPLGWIFGDWYRPWQRRFPSDPHFNADIYNRREYPPLSLLELQRLIDLGWLDARKPIDLGTLCRTKQFRCDPLQRHFGVQLTDEGADVFRACVDIEVQAATEPVIAAVERRGGRVTAAYYDPPALAALADPTAFFRRGQPIPKRALPAGDLLRMYTDPAQRGYLAEPSRLERARFELSQKYGYALPAEPLRLWQKDPLQVFHGLEPGWVVSLSERLVYKPTSPEVVDFYNS